MFVAALCSILGACGGAQRKAEAPEVERVAYVGQPCPGLELGSEPLKPANVRVFFEVAEITTAALPSPIGRWLDTHAVKVRATANLVAFDGVPTSVPWGPCVDAVCSAMTLSLTLTSRLPERASEAWPVTLSITEAASESSSTGNPRVWFEAALQVSNQQVVVLPPAPEVTDGSIVVTAYLLQKHDDLHRVMECQVEQSARVQQSRQVTSD